MVALGDFNAKSSNWGSKDITSDKGRKIETGIQQNVLHQINELTHILYTFSNIDVDKMVPIFNQTIISILCNFIPHETILFDERDLVG